MELGHGPGQDAERATARVVGSAMLAVAAYVVAQAAWSLAAGAHPQQDLPAVVLLAASVAVLPVLGGIKLRLARRLHSPALRGDGVLSTAGAVSVATAVAGLAVGKTLGWWQAGPVAASVIALFLFWEGRRTLAHAGR